MRTRATLVVRDGCSVPVGDVTESASPAARCPSSRSQPLFFDRSEERAARDVDDARVAEFDDVRDAGVAAANVEASLVV